MLTQKSLLIFCNIVALFNGKSLREKETLKKIKGTKKETDKHGDILKESDQGSDLEKNIFL